MSIGDCFVVVTSEGRYWTGEAWTSVPEQAHPFAGVSDPYADAEEVSNRLRTQGVSCTVGYLLRSDVVRRSAPVKSDAIRPCMLDGQIRT